MRRPGLRSRAPGDRVRRRSQGLCAPVAAVRWETGRRRLAVRRVVVVIVGGVRRCCGQFH